MVVAVPATAARRTDIASATLLHVTAAEKAARIVEEAWPTGAPVHANCRIHLVGGQGWSIAPFRLLRDYSIVDPFLNHLKDWGCYTYFFLGEPGGWAYRKNISPLGSWASRDDRYAVFRVDGADLVENSELIFYRPDDRVVIVRGDYRGWAEADPPPPRP